MNHKICSNLVSVLQKRGYSPKDDCEVLELLTVLSVNEWNLQFTLRSSIILEFIHRITLKKMIVLFADDANIGKQQILNYVQKFEDLDADAGILVIKNDFDNSRKPITSIAESVLRGLDTPIEIFEDCELVFNIFDHVLQPQFTLVHASEHAAIFSTFANWDKLPRIRTTDPVVRLLGAKSRDIIRVENIVETSGTQINYLCVL
jgi:DNA-directed RNA polymerase subunit H (RpoH/RPB5)